MSTYQAGSWYSLGLNQSLLALARPGEHFALDEAADDVADDDMAFLDLRRLAGGHAQAMIAERRHLAARVAGEADRDDVARAAGGERGEHVRRAPRGRKGDEDVAGPAERLELAREHPVETVVVADRRQGRGVGRQRDGGKRR